VQTNTGKYLGTVATTSKSAITQVINCQLFLLVLTTHSRINKIRFINWASARSEQQVFDAVIKEGAYLV